MTNKPASSSVRLTDYLYRKASAALIPLSGTFELSPVCNLSCRMCYVRKTHQEVRESPRGIMELEQWLQIARQAREEGMLYLLLTGGEPFLWPDFWTLYEQLVAMGFLVSINTNGTLIDDAAVQRLKRYPPRRVNITLYGASDDTYRSLCGVGGMYSRVDGAISRLKEAGINVKLNCSLTPYNVGDLERMVAYAQERKLVLDTASYMFPPVRRDPGMVGINDRFTPEQSARCRMENYRLQNGPERYKIYLQSILRGSVEPPSLEEGCIDPVDGKIRCRAGKAAFWITWDGWMTPCGMMTQPRVDIKTGSFRDNWKELNRQCAQVRVSGVCSQCSNQYICHPCAAMALTETGSPAGIPRYLCQTAAAMRERAAKELEKL